LEAFSPYNAVEELDTLCGSFTNFHMRKKIFHYLLPIDSISTSYCSLLLTLRFSILPCIILQRNCNFLPWQSSYTDGIKSHFEDNISILNDDYSGRWYGCNSYNDIGSSKKLDHRKLDEMLINMTLPFVPSQELSVLVNFSGTGTDTYGIFNITDGIWSANGCIQFHTDYPHVFNLKLINILQQKLVDSDQEALPPIHNFEDLYDEEDEDDYQDGNPGGLRCYGRVLPVGIFGICAANEGAFWMWRACEQPNGIGEWR